MSNNASREEDVSMEEASADELTRNNTAANALIGRTEMQEPEAAGEAAERTVDGNVAPTQRVRSSRARDNPDTIRAARFGGAEAMSTEQTRRYNEYRIPAERYAKDTEKLRNYALWHKGNKNTRDGERARLAARIPQIEAELAKARADLAAMDAADAKEWAEHGEQITAGQEAERLVEKHQKFLEMEHDEEPDL